MKRFLVVFSLVVLFPFTNIAAQSLTMTSPGAQVQVPEGDDYATSELGDPWDFKERRDIGWEENFRGDSVSVAGNVWTGVNQVAGGYVFPIFPGFKNSLFSEGLSGDKTLPRLGINHRVNASKYSHLSYRLNHTDRGTFAVYWEGDDAKQEYWPDPNSSRGASFDGYYHWNSSYKNSGYNLYSFNLNDLNNSFEQKQGSWSGNPFALRIDPSVGGGVGATTQIDWIRLVDPSSAPNLTVTWNSSGISEFSIITVYYDTNASGYQGTPLKRFVSGNNPGTYTFPTAILPPGTYYFYVTAQLASGGSFMGAPVQSNYSAPLVVVPKPIVNITAPSMVSGEEYATNELQKPWNMTEAADVPNLDAAVWPATFRQFSTAHFSAIADAQAGGAVFAAQADPPLPGNTESDVQVHLNVSKAKPIDTGKYRYLTYRIAVDESLYPTVHDKVEKGWVMRPVWWNNIFTLNHHRAKAHVLYEGWHEYGTDLSDASIMEYGSPWTAFPTFNSFRVDPLETPQLTWFFLDYVRLYAENRAATGFYDIKYNVENPAGGNVTTQLYYSTTKTTSGGTLIATLQNQAAGEHTYRWDTSGLATDSSYYVYAVVSNGVASNSAHSPVHVKIGPYQPAARTIPPVFDFDGDGKSDQTVFRPGLKGQYFFNKSAAGYQALDWGNQTFVPVTGDFDGDGTADRGLVVNLSGSLWWYIVRSSDGLLYSKAWGLAGDRIVFGDYNGNGVDELAVYREGAWFILDEENRGLVHHWGLPGTDIPVPADYDGDGKTDIAIFRKTDGMWWIINSGFSTGVAANAYTVTQWGLPWVGDIGVPADYTGDGKADLAVWRPIDGTWYVKNLVDDSVTSQQWGLPGDVPLAGHDGNGDGVKDFVVFRPGTGMWFYNYRNGTVNGVQFGLPGDLVPVKVQNS